eukprot:TRINITY_DN2899_c1_g1_i1.p1 TRINITY_DN2899_c1_g1~~TRINITY_DN2899_c1_g1_i1.p1  ORF type:complete len:251 (+),score=38.78 TRINITY_DN2899_c1_g1_i1:105-857(+)
MSALVQCNPATQFCCGCSTLFGTKLTFLANLARFAFLLFVAIDAVMHKPELVLVTMPGTLAFKVCLAGWSVAGISLLLFGYWGINNKCEPAVRLSWMFLVATIILDVSMFIYEIAVNSSCEAVKFTGGQNKPLACGIVRFLNGMLFILSTGIEAYLLFIVASYADDIGHYGGGQKLYDLGKKADYDPEGTAYYMAGVGSKAVGKATSLAHVVAGATGVEVSDDGPYPPSYPIYGTYHNMQFPPNAASLSA